MTPIEVVARPLTKRGMATLAQLIAAREVEMVVVGLPLSLRGEDTEQTRETREFASRLGQELSVPVELHDERFTTRMAQRMEGATTSRGLSRRRAPTGKLARLIAW